jgi:hypothetical protein
VRVLSSEVVAAATTYPSMWRGEPPLGADADTSADQQFGGTLNQLQMSVQASRLVEPLCLWLAGLRFLSRSADRR